MSYFILVFMSICAKLKYSILINPITLTLMLKSLKSFLGVYKLGLGMKLGFYKWVQIEYHNVASGFSLIDVSLITC